MNLSKNTKISQAIAPSAGVAGSTDLNGAVLDMSGFDGVLMIVTFGVITGSAVTAIKAQQDTAVAMGTAADLLGTGQTVADTDDDGVFYIDLYKPLERYVRVVVERATQNAVVSSAQYIQYRGAKPPASHGSAVSGELHVSPIEGTA